ncbi:MAG: hypothetical protein QOI66_2784, partial [Myxococcales bacterium]|nr:hypothetical protein [Myxococcales bacterium]
IRLVNGNGNAGVRQAKICACYFAGEFTV